VQTVSSRTTPRRVVTRRTPARSTTHTFYYYYYYYYDITTTLLLLLQLLQLVLSHLLVDGFVLHPVRGDARPLLENVQNDSPEGAPVDAAAPADTERAQRRGFGEI